MLVYIVTIGALRKMSQMLGKGVVSGAQRRSSSGKGFESVLLTKLRIFFSFYMFMK